MLTYCLKQPTTDAEMINLSNSRGGGTGAEDLGKACGAIGYCAALSTMTTPQLLHYNQVTGVPVIVLWGQPDAHRVVVVGQQGNSLLISDPNQGNIQMTAREFSRRWQDGEALTIQPTD